MSIRYYISKLFRRPPKPVNWHNLRNIRPVSTVFGLDRGRPVDRYYIEKFLEKNSGLIRGTILEIADSTYSKKFATGTGNKLEVLHYTRGNPQATIVGNLADSQSLPKEMIDCFICTQTFQFIYPFMEAIKGAYHLLKKDGVLLATMAGITQVSKYDMDRWGDYWRFTTLSATKAFEEVFGKGHVQVEYFGNVLSTVAFLQGISAEELTPEELDYKDENYQMLITVIARK